jgi:hypothetical protein
MSGSLARKVQSVIATRRSTIDLFRPGTGRARMEPLEHRRLLAGWAIEPVFEQPVMDYINQNAEHYQGYDLFSMHLDESGKIKWEARLNFDEAFRTALHWAEGTELQARYDESLPSDADHPGLSSPDFNTFVAAYANKLSAEKSIENLPPVDFTFSTFDGNRFSLTGPYDVSKPAEEFDQTFTATESTFNDKVLFSMKAPPGAPGDYSLFVRVFNVDTDKLVNVEQTRSDFFSAQADVVINGDNWDVRMRTTGGALPAGEYIWTFYAGRKEDANDACVPVQTMRVSIEQDLNVVLKSDTEIERIVDDSGKEYEVVRGEWIIRIDGETAPGSRAVWESPTDVSLFDGPGSNPALHAALQQYGFSLDSMLGFPDGSFASIRANSPTEYRAAMATLKAIPWVTSVEPNGIMYGARGDGEWATPGVIDFKPVEPAPTPAPRETPAPPQAPAIETPAVETPAVETPVIETPSVAAPEPADQTTDTAPSPVRVAIPIASLARPATGNRPTLPFTSTAIITAPRSALDDLMSPRRDRPSEWFAE